MKAGYRFATERDILDYYGSRPVETIRALVFTLDDEVMGVIGIARQETLARFFGEFKEEFRKHLRSIPALRAIKLVQSWVSESVLPVYVIAEETEPDAVRFLTRFGFVPYEENILTWRNSRPSSRTS